MSHFGPRNTRRRTRGIRIRAVIMRFMPRLRIHRRGDVRTGWQAANALIWMEIG
jgi:hypothetical protein